VLLGLPGPSGPLDATIRPPGSKSETNRALVCAALASGTSRLEGALRADDTEAMVDCLRALGVEVDWSGPVRSPTLTVRGTGGRPAATGQPLDARLSGTTSRFLAPVAALGPSEVTVTGAEGLLARPMGDLVDALRSLGAGVDELGAPGHLPLRLGGRPVRGGTAVLPGHTSSQFLSGLLLVGPVLPDGLQVRVETPLVSLPYVELTLDVMRRFGAVVHGSPEDGWQVEPGGYEAQDLVIEADASAASYFMAAPLLAGGRVRVEGVGAATRQGDAAFADLLGSMGARVDQGPDWTEVHDAGVLRGIDADLRDSSDVAQTLAVVASVAAGVTRVRGIGFIRAKETDRVGAVVRELGRVGIRAVEEPDGFAVTGGVPHAARIRTYGDHRMAMSFALLSLRVPGIVLEDPACVDKTYPRFFDDLAAVIGAGGSAGSSAP